MTVRLRGGLPTTLNGASITVTVGGTTVNRGVVLRNPHADRWGSAGQHADWIRNPYRDAQRHG